MFVQLPVSRNAGYLTYLQLFIVAHVVQVYDWTVIAYSRLDNIVRSTVNRQNFPLWKPQYGHFTNRNHAQNAFEI